MATKIDNEKNAIVNEKMLGVINSKNRIFKTSKYFQHDSVLLFINGLQEKDYRIINDNTLQLTYVPSNVGFVDSIEIQYLTK